jgi:hypothetical protein
LICDRTGIAITSLFTLVVVAVLVTSSVEGQSPKGVFDSKKLSLSNLTAIPVDYGYAQSWDIIGTVKNISNKTLENIELVADMYNPSNQLINVVTGSPSFANLPPGDESSFKIQVSLYNSSTVFDHYVIRADEKPNQFGKLLGLLGNVTKLGNLTK